MIALRTGPYRWYSEAAMRKTVKSMIDDALAAITPYSIDAARSLHGRDDVSTR